MMKPIDLALSAAVVALLSACASEPSSKPEPAAPAAASSVSPAPPPEAGANRGQSLSESPLGARQAATIDKRSIYYDFDSFAMKAEYKPVIESQANYLKQHPDASVTVEGNCDERGGREYNLALGQRRADAVRKFLELAGVPAKQIDTTSYGKEKPRALGHDEQAWSENRRSDFDFNRQ